MSEEVDEEHEEQEDEERPDLVPVQRNQCPHCFAQFTLEKNYVDHMWTAHGSKRPFRCDDCGIFLSYRSSLYNHKKIHSDKRPFACSDCSAKFRWNNSLKYHMARAHQKVAIITAKQVTATAPLPSPPPGSTHSKAAQKARKSNISAAIDTVLERVKEEAAQEEAEKWEEMEAGPSEEEAASEEPVEEDAATCTAIAGGPIAQLLMASAFLAAENGATPAVSSPPLPPPPTSQPAPSPSVSIAGNRKRKVDSATTARPRKSNRKAAKPSRILQPPPEDPETDGRGLLFTSSPSTLHPTKRNQMQDH